MSHPDYKDFGSVETRAIEEMAELTMAISKAVRFGYVSYHPDHPNGPYNPAAVLSEIKDVRIVLKELEKAALKASDEVLDALETYKVYTVKPRADGSKESKASFGQFLSQGQADRYCRMKADELNKYHGDNVSCHAVRHYEATGGFVKTPVAADIARRMGMVEALGRPYGGTMTKKQPFSQASLSNMEALAATNMYREMGAGLYEEWLNEKGRRTEVRREPYQRTPIVVVVELDDLTPEDLGKHRDEVGETMRFLLQSHDQRATD